MDSKHLDPLSRLAVRFGCDKYGAHLYTPLYHKLFAPLRELPLRILEIGVGGYGSAKAGGGSLRMWAEYFPLAKIFGLDVAKKDLSMPPRVRIIEGSQVDLELLATLSDDQGPFDIVIDDGSHFVSHVQTTFRFLYPRLPPNGIYVVEDTQTAFLPPVGGNATGNDTIFSLAHAVSMAMHRREGYAPPKDDAEIIRFGDITGSVSIHRNMIVFERANNTYPSNFGLDFNDPQVQDVFESIRREARNNPSPRCSLSRIEMAVWGSQAQRAAELALATADAYPNEVETLTELVRMMEFAKRDDVIHVVKAKLERLS